jgi:hypothetical protein
MLSKGTIMNSHYLITAIFLIVGVILTSLPLLFSTPNVVSGMCLGFNSGLLFCHLLNWWYDL